MADKPSRALVIFGDGLASLLSASHANLQSLASGASCGFLSLRAPPPDEAVVQSRVRELAQLLDAYDSLVARNRELGGADTDNDSKKFSNATISERFMGLRAALFSSCSSVSSFGENIGLSALQIDELIKPTDPSDDSLKEVPADSTAVSRLLQLLGISGGDSKEVNWLNKLAGGLMEIAQPGSQVASRLHISVVLSYGTLIESNERFSLVVNSSDSVLSLLRPRQSYTMKGGNTLSDVRHDHPMLIAQWQEGVTCRDKAKSFSFDEFRENGCNRAILADRFIHELAFKLCKAPKYGASRRYSRHVQGATIDEVYLTLLKLRRETLLNIILS